jgi:hypothetical protein
MLKRAHLLCVNFGRSRMSIERIALAVIAIASVGYNLFELSKPSVANAQTAPQATYLISAGAGTAGVWLIDQAAGKLSWCTSPQATPTVNCYTGSVP